MEHNNIDSETQADIRILGKIDDGNFHSVFQHI